MCSTSCGFALQQWIEEMAVHMKAVDPNHLVTIGEEGFYSTTCERCLLCPSHKHTSRSELAQRSAVVGHPVIEL